MISSRHRTAINVFLVGFAVWDLTGAWLLGYPVNNDSTGDGVLEGDA